MISRGSFYWHGLTLIPIWISDHMPSKVWGEIISPFANVNGCTVEVCEWISNFISHNLKMFVYHIAENDFGERHVLTRISKIGSTESLGVLSPTEYLYGAACGEGLRFNLQTPTDCPGDQSRAAWHQAGVDIYIYIYFFKWHKGCFVGMENFQLVKFVHMILL